MADNNDELDLDGSESTGGDSTPKKASGLTALLPNLLKFIAIGLGALIFIVTVSVITYRILSGSGKTQTAVTETDPYTGKRPQYSWFTTIGVIRTRTKDPTPYSVVVNLIIGYDMNDKNGQTELTNRLYELKDFVRNFFSTKTAAELKAENEIGLKQQIKELLNTTILENIKAREILFQQLDVVEM
jgi:flagellar FliL protein